MPVGDVPEGERSAGTQKQRSCASDMDEPAKCRLVLPGTSLTGGANTFQKYGSGPLLGRLRGFKSLGRCS